MMIWDNIVKPRCLSALNFLVFFRPLICMLLLMHVAGYGIKRTILRQSTQEGFKNGSWDYFINTHIHRHT